MNRGITVAGNMIVDIIKLIESYPSRHNLTTITGEISRSMGGLLCNVIVDLAKMDASLPLKAVGIVGNDAEGDFILNEFAKHKNIDVLHVMREGTTSFTDVMTEIDTKARTFFHYRGANALLEERHFDFEAIDTDMLHIGYILLLDGLDAHDEQYGTVMARVLAKAQAKGIKTSIDVVSEAGERFNRLVPPSLKYTDYCIINEIEAAQTTKIPLRGEEGTLLTQNMPKVCKALLDMGVSTWAVIHTPEGGFGMDNAGNYVAKGSLALPEGFIKGTVGAGDAFCAGVLYAAYAGESLFSAIETGIATAACSLKLPGATDSMEPIEKVRELYAQMPKRDV